MQIYKLTFRIKEVRQYHKSIKVSHYRVALFWIKLAILGFMIVYCSWNNKPSISESSVCELVKI